MTLREKAIHGLLWSSAGKWGDKLSSFIVFLVLVRLLSPEDFGLAALAVTFISLFQLFIDQGLSAAIVQRKHVEPEHLDTAFWTNVLFGLVMASLVILAAGPIANFLNEPDLRAILTVLSALCLFKGSYGIHRALLRRSLNFKALTVRSLLAQVTGGIVGITMAFSGFGVWSLVAQQFTFNLVTLTVLWFSSGWMPGFRFSKKHFFELFPFSINVFGIHILLFLNTRSLPFLIGFFLGTTQLGYFVVAHKILVTLTDLFSTAITQVAFPVFSKLQSEPERLRRAFYTATKHVSLLSFPIFIGLALISHDLITLAFGDRWSTSAPVLSMLAFIGALYSVANFNNEVLLAVGKSSWRMILDMTTCITNITIFFLVFQMGIFAISIGYVLAGYVLSPIPIIALSRLIGVTFKTYYKQYIIPITGCLNMALIILLLQNFFIADFDLLLRIITTVISGAIIYAMTVLIIDRKQVKTIIHTVSPFFAKIKFGTS